MNIVAPVTELSSPLCIYRIVVSKTGDSAIFPFIFFLDDGEIGFFVYHISNKRREYPMRLEEMSMQQIYVYLS